MGVLSPIYGKLKFMFQTTNQIQIVLNVSIPGSRSWWVSRPAPGAHPCRSPALEKSTDHGGVFLSHRGYPIAGWFILVYKGKSQSNMDFCWGYPYFHPERHGWWLGKNLYLDGYPDGPYDKWEVFRWSLSRCLQNTCIACNYMYIYVYCFRQDLPNW